MDTTHQNRIGFARVSTQDQKLEPQIARLRALGCDQIYTVKETGAKPHSDTLEECFAQLQSGDILVVTALDRLSRSQKHLASISERLEANGIELLSDRERIDTTSAMGRMFFTIAGAFAQFERDLIRERTKAGLDAAAAQGRKGGRPTALDEAGIDSVRQMLAGTTIPVKDIAAQHGIKPSTVYKYFPGGRAALTGS
jgi:DNA invertase Pin-like site-specific DNA recombinase